MVRVSDARMSGTAYGTVVLHAAPEAAVGGPLALVENGDMITLDAAGRQVDAACRRASASGAAEGLGRAASANAFRDIRGSTSTMCCRRIAAATWIFLSGRRGAAVPRHSH